MNVELRKVHFNERMSDETNCFDAEIWVDGEKLAFVCNHGTGGSNEYQVVGDRIHGQGNPKWEAFEAFCKAQPHEFDFEITDQYVDGLFSEWVKKDNERREKARIKRMCQTKTVYRLKDDPEGTVWTIKAPFSPAVEAKIVAKYGDKLELIYNKAV